MRNDWRVTTQLPMPARRDYPLPFVGAGSIVNNPHLLAYRKANFNVAGIKGE